MILDLGDGRELKLPDNMDEDAARMLGRFIKATEERANTAEASARALRSEIDSLRGEVRAIPAPTDLKPLADAIAGLHTDLNAGINRMVKAQLAERKLVMDDMGEYTRSKAVG